MAFLSKLAAIQDTTKAVQKERRSAMELALGVQPHASDSISDDGVEYGDGDRLISTGGHVLRELYFQPRMRPVLAPANFPPGELVLSNNNQTNTGYVGYIISPPGSRTSAPSVPSTTTSSTDATTPTTSGVNTLGPYAQASRVPPAKHYVDQLKIAQTTMHMSSNARLFVGNLPASHTDDDLCCIVSYEFERYGRCAAAVFRKKGPGGVAKPYAIVQFAVAVHAAAALTGMQGVGIGMGAAVRPIRVEWSNRR